MRTRREQLSAQQLMRKNPSEAIVGKDNHLRDALKCVLLSLPSPSEIPVEDERERIIREAYETGNYQTIALRMLRYDADRRINTQDVSYLSRLPRGD